MLRDGGGNPCDGNLHFQRALAVETATIPGILIPEAKNSRCLPTLQLSQQHYFFFMAHVHLHLCRALLLYKYCGKELRLIHGLEETVGRHVALMTYHGQFKLPRLPAS